MKKIIMSSAILMAAIFSACNSSNTSDLKNDTAATTSNADSSKVMSAVKYTCTMHPEIISDTAGHCPKCGMDLVLIK